MKIYLKVIEPTTTRLALTRLIRISTGMSLADSKRLCDRINTHPFPSEQIIISDEFKTKHHGYALAKFKQELSDMDGKFLISGGIQQERDLKILAVGIGDDVDYVSAIVEHLKVTNDSDLLSKIVSKLDKESKIEIVKDIIDDISRD